MLQLQSIIMKKDEQLQSLTLDLTAKSKALDILSSKSESMSSQENIAKELAEKVAECETLKVSQQQLLSQEKKLIAEVQSQYSQIETLSQSKKKLIDQEKYLQKTCDGLKKQIENLSSNIPPEQNINSLEIEIEKLRKEQTNNLCEIDSFKQMSVKYSECLSNYENLNSKYNSLTEKYTLSLSEIEELKRIRDNLKSETDAATANSGLITDLQNEIASLKEENAQNISEKNVALSELNTLQEQYTTDTEKLQNKVNELQNKVCQFRSGLDNSSSADMNSQMSEIEALSSKVKDLEANVEYHKNLNENYLKNIEELKLSLSKSVSESNEVEIKEDTMRLSSYFSSEQHTQVHTGANESVNSVCSENLLIETKLKEEICQLKTSNEEMLKQEKLQAKNCEDLQCQLESTVLHWQQLQKIVQEKEIDIQNLQEQVDEKKRICTTQKKNYEDQLQDLKDELETMTKCRNSDLLLASEQEQLLKSLKLELDNMKLKDTDVTNTTHKISELQKQFNACQEQLEQEISKHKEKEMKLENLEKCVEDSNVEVSDLKSKLKDKSNQLSILVDQLFDERESTYKLNILNRKFEKEFKEHTNLEKKNQSEMAELKKKLGDIEVQYQDLQTSFENQGKEFTERQAKISQLSDHLSELQTELQNKTKEISNEEMKVKEMETTMAERENELMIQLEVMNKKWTTSERACNDLKSVLSFHLENDDKKEDLITFLKVQYDNNDYGNVKSNQCISEQQASIKGLEELNQQQTQQLEESSNEHKELMKSIIKIQKDKQIHESQYLHYKEENKLLQDRLQNTIADLMRLEEDLTSNKHQYEKDKESLIEELSKKDQHITKLTEELSNSHSGIKDTQHTPDESEKEGDPQNHENDPNCSASDSKDKSYVTDNEPVSSLQSEIDSLKTNNLALENKLVQQQEVISNLRMKLGVEDICPPFKDSFETENLHRLSIDCGNIEEGFSSSICNQPVVEGFVAEKCEQSFQISAVDDLTEPDFMEEKSDVFEPEQVIETIQCPRPKLYSHPIDDDVITEGWQPETPDKFLSETEVDSNPFFNVPKDLSVGLSPSNTKNANKFHIEPSQSVSSSETCTSKQEESTGSNPETHLTDDSSKLYSEEDVEKKIKGMQEELEDQYTARLKKQEVDLSFEYDLRENKYRQEMEHHFEQKVKAVRYEWERKFTKAFQKVRRKVEKQYQQKRPDSSLLEDTSTEEKDLIVEENIVVKDEVVPLQTVDASITQLEEESNDGLVQQLHKENHVSTFSIK